MFNIYRPLAAETAVEHSAVGRFIRADRSSLLAAGRCCLRAYDLRDGDGGERRLRLQGEWSFFGTIVSMQVLPADVLGRKGSALDAVLLTFEDAQMSVVAFDPASEALETVQIIDAGALANADSSSAWRVRLDGPQGETRIDPQHRIAAVALRGDRMVFAPLLSARDARRAPSVGDVGDEEEPLLGEPFPISLHDNLGVRGTVKDWRFLAGCRDPTLAFLVELAPTWAGSVTAAGEPPLPPPAPMGAPPPPQQPPSCVLVAFALTARGDPSRGMHPQFERVWQMDRLPADAFALRPVPAPLGGVVVLSDNALIYAKHGQCCALRANGFSRITLDARVAPRTARLHPRRDYFLRGAVSTFLRPDLFLLCLQSGEVFGVVLRSLATAGMTTARALAPHLPDSALGGLGVGQISELESCLLSHSVVATTACVLPRRAAAAAAAASSGASVAHVFLGSRRGRSVVVRYEAAAAGAEAGAPAGKRAKLAHGGAAPAAAGAEEEEDDDDDIYGSSGGGAAAAASAAAASVAASSAAALPPRLVVDDALAQLGGVAHAAAGHRPGALPADGSTVGLGREELVCCTGEGASGSISVVHQGLFAEQVAEFPLAGATDAWTVTHGGGGGEEEEGGDAATRESFLLLTTPERTVVLDSTFGGQLDELSAETSPFYMAGATLDIGRLVGGRCAAQIYGDGVRLIDLAAGACVCEMLLDDALDAGGIGAAPGVAIVAASVVDPHVLLLLSDGAVRVLKVDAGDLDFGTLDAPGHAAFAAPRAACLFNSAGWARAAEGAGINAVRVVEVAGRAAPRSAKKAKRGAKKNKRAAAMEDDDALLYGGSGDGGQKRTAKGAAKGAATAAGGDAAAAQRSLVALVDATGTLSVFALPSFEVLLTVRLHFLLNLHFFCLLNSSFLLVAHIFFLSVVCAAEVRALRVRLPGGGGARRGRTRRERGGAPRARRGAARRRARRRPDGGGGGPLRKLLSRDPHVGRRAALRRARERPPRARRAQRRDARAAQQGGGGGGGEGGGGGGGGRRGRGGGRAQRGGTALPAAARPPLRKRRRRARRLHPRPSPAVAAREARPGARRRGAHAAAPRRGRGGGVQKDVDGRAGGL